MGHSVGYDTQELAADDEWCDYTSAESGRRRTISVWDNHSLIVATSESFFVCGQSLQRVYYIFRLANLDTYHCAAWSLWPPGTAPPRRFIVLIKYYFKQMTNRIADQKVIINLRGTCPPPTLSLSLSPSPVRPLISVSLEFLERLFLWGMSELLLFVYYYYSTLTFIIIRKFRRYRNTRRRVSTVHCSSSSFLQYHTSSRGWAALVLFTHIVASNPLQRMGQWWCCCCCWSIHLDTLNNSSCFTFPPPPPHRHRMSATVESSDYILIGHW